MPNKTNAESAYDVSVKECDRALIEFNRYPNDPAMLREYRRAYHAKISAWWRVLQERKLKELTA
jgi:hypothetical protein